jgi:SAM-dependent methyltransferase
MNDRLKGHYKTLFKKHGDSSQAVQWTDRGSHFKRFEILKSISDDINSVIDLGCGLAHLYEYMLNGGYKGKYLGLDFVPEFIEANKDKYKGVKQVNFELFDITKDNLPTDYEYVIVNGVFNNKQKNNKEFMLNSIVKMFNACKKGVAFNAMSTYVDFFDDDLYYSDPLEIFDFCKKNLTRKITLRHDYIVKERGFPFEYTIYLYK